MIFIRLKLKESLWKIYITLKKSRGVKYGIQN